MAEVKGMVGGPETNRYQHQQPTFFLRATIPLAPQCRKNSLFNQTKKEENKVKYNLNNYCHKQATEKKRKRLCPGSKFWCRQVLCGKSTFPRIPGILGIPGILLISGIVQKWQRLRSRGKDYQLGKVKS